MEVFQHPTLIASTIGVCQVSPTSCLLFVIFVNNLIKLIKHSCGTDGFLGWLHILVLMDGMILQYFQRPDVV